MLRLNKKATIKIPEYKQYSRLRLLSFFIIGIIGVGLIGGVLFIYTNIYETIGQTQATINLNGNLTMEIIDFTRYDKVDKIWQKKYSEKEIILNRDPFNAVVEVVNTEEETE